MRIEGLKLNHLVEPLGYDLGEKQSFSWTVENALGKKQTAARICVKQGESVIADTGWDDLDSRATALELPLLPRTRYTWSVAVKTDAGEEALAESWFETGKLDEPWKAKWIGCCNEAERLPIFSKKVDLNERKVSRARLYICGLGLYGAYWNGEKIGEELLAPYCNHYNRWVQYQSYDVTGQLQASGTLSVELGNGWYKGRFGFDVQAAPYYGSEWKLIAELHLLYEDGSEEVVGTDESWLVSRSNIHSSGIYDGECRDDTLPSVTAVSAVLAQSPRGALCARMSTPVKVRRRLPVRELIHTPAGETVLDLGQNMAGGFELRVNAPSGTKVHLQFGEILQGGNFYRDNLRSAKAEYLYVSDGKEHLLRPEFTFYGYRYVKVEGLSELKPQDFTGLVYYSEIPHAGRLETGNALINQLISNAEWGQLSNFIDVPTDCPQRDERLGWTGDAQEFAPTACFQRDSYAFFAKYIRDVWMEQQDKNGAVPMVVPAFDCNDASSAWGDVAVLIPWTLYQWYGDAAIFETQYDSMKSWVDYVNLRYKETPGWTEKFHFGDWLALDGDGKHGDTMGGTDLTYICDLFFCKSAELVSRAAELLGRDEEAEEYKTLYRQTLEKVQEEYFTPSGRCAINTQTALILALDHHVAPNRKRTAEDLVTLLKENDGMLNTGFLGTPKLCSVLTEIGQEDMAFDLLLNEEYPGWLYCVKLGATTIWERWNSVLEDGTISPTGMNSLNHYCYGSIVQWMYEDMAGLKQLEPGFKRALLAPHFNWKIGQAEVEYASASGTWKINWKLLENGDITYSCTVPFECTAKLRLPLGGGEYELESGEFTKTYTPNSPVHKVYHTGLPLSELMNQPKCRNLIFKHLPKPMLMPRMKDEKITLQQLAEEIGQENVLMLLNEQLGRL